MTSEEVQRLRERVAELEARLSQVSQSVSTQNAQGHTFDFEKHAVRKIALKFCYDGSHYCGLALQNGVTPLPTVEEKLLDALLQAKLIPSRDLESIGFARCGRTDRGVSASAQVVSLWVRSAMPQSQSRGDNTASEDEDTYDRAKRAHAPADTLHGELQYDHLLNRLLPATIRILAWSPVHADFDARFSCLSRHYKYFFSEMPHARLDLEAMQEAADRLVGEHDFRNFCKIDGSKQIVDYRRNILSAKLEIADGLGTDRLCALNLIGTAFLWHQVRHIVAILFYIGAGLEKPDVIDDLLKVDLLPSKPSYEMADALPLVLYDVHFPKHAVRWMTSTARTRSSLHASAEDAKIRMAIARSHIQALDEVSKRGEASQRAELQRGAGLTSSVSARYRPLAQRDRALHFEEVNRRWLAKQRST